MKETHYKLKHRVTALFAAAVMLCSMLPGAAFAEEPTPQPTEETVQMEQQTEPSETDNGQTDESSPDPGEDVTEATPEAAEEQPAEEEIPAAVVGAELYTDLPNAPIGSYIGSEGLPVATGETKIGISEWPESQLEETSGSYLTAAALDNDGLGKGSRGSSSDSLQTAGRELCMPDEIRRMRDDECLLLMRSEDPVIDKKYNLLHHPNVKYTPDAGGEP